MKIKSLLKIGLSLILLLSMLLNVSCVATPPPETPPADPDDDVFTPILRFAVTSDVHVREGEDDLLSSQRLTEFFTTAYAYADSQSYNKLDGIFIVGDLTNKGTPAEYEKFFRIFNENTREGTLAKVLNGNHEFYNWNISGEATYDQAAVERGLEKFLEYTGYENKNMHEMLGGYHFLLLSIDTFQKDAHIYTTDESLAWLREELAVAAADDPSGTKPIFVFQHTPLKGSVNGFGGGDANVSEILKEYPQVISFSGHTHHSPLSPKQVWQDGFTAIGTGSLAYLGLFVAGHPDYSTDSVIETDKYGSYTNHGYSNRERNAGMYRIVELDKNHRVKISTYNIFSGGIDEEPIILEVGDPDKFIYPIGWWDEYESKLAAFPEGSDITVIRNDPHYAVIDFPAADGEDGVNSYRIDIHENSTIAKQLYFLAGEHYGTKRPDTARIYITGLKANTTYKITIYPTNRFDMRGDPLVSEFTTGDKLTTPDILETVFSEDGGAINGATGESLSPSGETSVGMNADIGRLTATMTGENGYLYTDIEDWYMNLYKSLTVEAYINPGELRDMAIGANCDSAGFGITVTEDGRYRFLYRAMSNSQNAYYIAETEAGVAKAGEWVHLVGVSTGSNVFLYLDGNLVMKTPITGMFLEPSDAASSFAIGGDVDSDGGFESGFVGEIATLNIYSRAFSATDIANLYLGYSEE